MIEYVAKKCPICGVHYCLDKDFDQHRQNGAKENDGSLLGWMCPNGHRLVYRENEATKLRRELDRATQRMAQKDDEIRDLENRRRAAVGQVTKLRNRVGHGVCPCCNRTFQNLHRHMASEHPDFAKEAAE